MIQRIEEALRHNPGVESWRIIAENEASAEQYYVGKQLETIRSVQQQSARVTVYSMRGDRMGDADFTAYASSTPEQLDELIASALSRAALISYDRWELPDGDEAEETLPSDMWQQDAGQLASGIARAVFSAPCPQGVSVNALQVFVKRTQTTVINSRGLRHTQQLCSAMIEAIPTFTDENESVQLYESFRFCDFNASSVRERIAEKYREVCDRKRAVHPTTPLTCDVMLAPQEITELMRQLAGQLDCREVYSGSGLYQLGDSIQQGEACDRIQLTLCGALPGCTSSGAFDDDGLRLGSVKVIEDGQAAAYHGSKRFAGYMKVTPTGTLGCMKLGSGSLDPQEARKQNVLEILSMSGLQLDPYSDYIGGQIRLGRLWEQGSYTPVSGISFSGRLSQVLAGLRIDNQNGIHEVYHGPDRVLLPQVTVM